MKTIVQDEVHGEIVYDESFWTGKKKLTVGGKPLDGADRTAVTLTADDGNTEKVSLKGNSILGVTVAFDNRTVTVIPKPTWYEIALSVLIFAFILVWGNVPSLVAIMPLAGGAIGGCISGVCAFLNFVLMRRVKQFYWKLLIFVGFFALALSICYGIGAFILALFGE